MQEIKNVPKVIVLLSDITFGGIAVQARQHAAILYERGLADGIYLLNGIGLDDNLRNWYESNIPVAIAPEFIRPRSGLKKVVDYYSIFKSRLEAIAHFHCFSQEYMNWQAILAAKLAGKKVVATLHHTVGWTRNPRALSMLSQRLAWSLVDRFIVTTNAGRELISPEISKKKICVVPCHVPQFTTLHSTSSPSRQLNIDEKDFVIISISRLVKTKGLIDLVKAVSNLIRLYPNLKLLILGEGPCETELREMARHTDGNIQLVGRVESIHEFLEVADVFALPSYEEGFGIVYVEAAHQGVPSIASSLPQVREVIVAGETGWLVPPGSVESLELTIKSIINNPQECQRRGENARQYCKKFLPDTVTKQLLAVYQEVV